MKITRCDRCGKVDEAAGAHSFGIASFYIGSIRFYQCGGELPSIEALDLCRKCQGKLDEFVKKFMKELE